MYRFFKVFKFPLYLVIVVTFINSIVFSILGIYESIKAWNLILHNQMDDGVHYPGITLISSLEVFLISLMFFIFSIGMAQLFLPNFNREQMQSHIPKWFQVDNFSQLKLILWETILTTLVVYAVSNLVQAKGNYNWNLIIIPLMILIISVALLAIRVSERYMHHNK